MENDENEIQSLLRAIERIQVKMAKPGISTENYNNLHKEKVCLARDLEFIRGY